MAVSIRLAKIGRKNAPSFRIVAATTRDKRNGKFLEVLGHYNPSNTPATLEFKEDRIKSWTEQGAQMTQSVKDLLAGKYTFKPYGKKAKGAKEEPTNETTTEATEQETTQTAE